MSLVGEVNVAVRQEFAIYSPKKKKRIVGTKWYIGLANTLSINNQNYKNIKYKRTDALSL